MNNPNPTQSPHNTTTPGALRRLTTAARQRIVGGRRSTPAAGAAAPRQPLGSHGDGRLPAMFAAWR